MKIEIKENSNEYKSVRNIPSGTLVKYTTSINDYKGYFGIVLTNTNSDGCGHIIYDIEDGVYYDDVDRYYIIKVYDDYKVKITVEC